jgi:hypothetical protein
MRWAYYLSFCAGCAGCGDIALVDVNTDVGKKDIDNLQNKVDDATAQMKILEQQNEQLKDLLKICQQNPLFNPQPSVSP